jgi:hypothetical protein
VIGRTAVAVIAGAVSALLVREALVSDTPPPARDRQPQEPRHIERTNTIREYGVLDEESIRRLIREELAAAPQTGSFDEAELAARPPARREDVETAHAIVQDAIVAGRWTQSDLDRMRTVMPRLDKDSLDSVLSQFHMAVNAQRLDIQALPP